MVGTSVLEIEIVGVFPHIEGEQGLQTAAYGIAGIDLLGDHQLALGIQ